MLDAVVCFHVFAGHGAAAGTQRSDVGSHMKFGEVQSVAVMAQSELASSVVEVQQQRRETPVDSTLHAEFEPLCAWQYSPDVVIYGAWLEPEPPSTKVVQPNAFRPGSAASTFSTSLYSGTVATAFIRVASRQSRPTVVNVVHALLQLCPSPPGYHRVPGTTAHPC